MQTIVNTMALEESDEGQLIILPDARKGGIVREIVGPAEARGKGTTQVLVHELLPLLGARNRSKRVQGRRVGRGDGKEAVQRLGGCRVLPTSIRAGSQHHQLSHPRCIRLHIGR